MKVCTLLALKEAEKAYRTKTAELHARVKVRITETVVDEDGNNAAEHWPGWAICRSCNALA